MRSHSSEALALKVATKLNRMESRSRRVSLSLSRRERTKGMMESVRNASEISIDTPAVIQSSVTDGGDGEKVMTGCQDGIPSVDADIGSGGLDLDSPVTPEGTAAFYASHWEDEVMRGAGGRRRPVHEAWHLGRYRSVPSRVVYHEQYLTDPYSVGGDFLLNSEKMGLMGRRGRGSLPWTDVRRW